MFDRLGGTIALGTDWILRGSMNMLRELACADALQPRPTSTASSPTSDLWQMATINAAIATATDGRIGSLAVGKLGRHRGLRRRGRDVTYRAVIDAGDDDVALVLRAGRRCTARPTW